MPLERALSFNAVIPHAFRPTLHFRQLTFRLTRNEYRRISATKPQVFFLKSRIGEDRPPFLPFLC